MTPEPEQQRNLNSFDFDNPSIERLQMPWCTSPSGFVSCFVFGNCFFFFRYFLFFYWSWYFDVH